MKNCKKTHILSALLVLGFVAISGCNGADNNRADNGTNASLDGVPVDISDFGMQEEFFSGQATLTDQGLVFEDSDLEISSAFMSLNSGALTLDAFADPVLEYNDEPAKLMIRMTGQIEDHSPGEVTVSLSGFTPRLLDTNEQALGTNTADELLQGLNANGVTFPEASTDEPITVTFSIVATDDDYSEITMTADADFFQRFEGQAE